MIRQLGLKNWRSYESVTIDLDAGTTFVVASNGVGKTSLAEAARWAIFGVVESGQSAVRAGSDSAVASVQLVLPDLRVLFVERTLRRTSRHDSPVVRLDGAQISEPEMFGRLIEAYGPSRPS